MIHMIVLKLHVPLGAMAIPRFWRPWMLEAEAPAWIRNCLAARGFKPEICKAP